MYLIALATSTTSRVMQIFIIIIIIVVYYELSKRNWTIRGKNRDKIKTSNMVDDKKQRNITKKKLN